MTKSKFFLFAIMCLLLLTSCSKDDDNTSTEPSNLLIGIWKPTKEIDRCPNQSDDIYNLTECEQMSRLNFNENGTFNSVSYNENNNDCVISIQSNSNWVLRNGDLYVTDEGTEEIVEFFEVTNNTLRLGEFDNEFCEGGIFYTEYQKVQE